MVSVSEQLCEDHNLEDDSSMSSAVFSCLKQPCRRQLARS